MYVIQYHQQLERIREMVTLRKNDDTHEAFYHDPKTGQLWKSFFPNRTTTFSGPKLLRPEPLPEKIELQLELCLNSGHTKDAIGLGIEYASKPQYWDEIFSLLETNRKRYSRANFFLFIRHLGVLTLTQSLKEMEIKLTNLPISEVELKKLQKRAKRIWFKRFIGS